MEITLHPGESLDLTAAPGAQLAQTGWNITAASDPMPPTPPPATGGNLIPNGLFVDPATKRASLQGWTQDPAKPGWINTHAKRPDSVSFLAQGDRDFPPPTGGNVWKGGNPSNAYLETLTAGNLPPHAKIEFSWEAAHHMLVGKTFWLLFGRTAAGVEEAIGVFSAVEGVPPTKVCDPIPAKLIDVSGKGFVQYRVRWDVALADDRDGVLVGDVKLILK